MRSRVNLIKERRNNSKNPRIDCPKSLLQVFLIGTLLGLLAPEVSSKSHQTYFLETRTSPAGLKNAAFEEEHKPEIQLFLMDDDLGESPLDTITAQSKLKAIPRLECSQFEPTSTTNSYKSKVSQNDLKSIFEPRKEVLCFFRFVQDEGDIVTMFFDVRETFELGSGEALQVFVNRHGGFIKAEYLKN